MATDFLVKQGRVMGGVRLVTDADVAHQTDLTNIRETGTTSSQAISAGTYFYLNDVLVRAKVDIANGATFTLNTNYEVVTAGGLNELKDSGWIRLSTYIYYRKIGKVVYLKTFVTGDLITASTWGAFGTLPSGYRPTNMVNVCLYTNLSSFQSVYVGTDGTVNFQGNVSATGAFSFLVD